MNTYWHTDSHIMARMEKSKRSNSTRTRTRKKINNNNQNQSIYTTYTHSNGERKNSTEKEKNIVVYTQKSGLVFTYGYSIQRNAYSLKDVTTKQHVKRKKNCVCVLSERIVCVRWGNETLKTGTGQKKIGNEKRVALAKKKKKNKKNHRWLLSLLPFGCWRCYCRIGVVVL